MNKIYKEGSIALGVVTGVKEYGIFVRIDKTTSGLIHISEIDNCYIKNINRYVELGELIRVRVLKIDGDMLRLSIKNLDYRITNRHDSKIKETVHGFNNLALHLDYWIEKELDLLKK